jgi:hypothetical protein
MTTNAALPPPPITKTRTFHKSGATEIRATILMKTEKGDKRIDVHIIDAARVVAILRGRNHPAAGTLEDVVDLAEALAEKHPDTHKIEITPLDPTGEAAAAPGQADED